MKTAYPQAGLRLFARGRLPADDQLHPPPVVILPDCNFRALLQHFPPSHEWHFPVGAAVRSGRFARPVLLVLLAAADRVDPIAVLAARLVDPAGLLGLTAPADLAADPAGCSGQFAVPVDRAAGFHAAAAVHQGAPVILRLHVLTFPAGSAELPTAVAGCAGYWLAAADDGPVHPADSLCLLLQPAGPG